MKRIMPALTWCLLLVIPITARSEDIVATWRHKNGHTMKLSMRDANHARMDTDKDNYILVNGKKAYMVSNQDGQWTAMDMDVLSGMMNQFGIRAGSVSHNADAYQPSFKHTGRTETIAGYKGTVYVAETKDESGQLIDRSEIVFSKHPDVERASKAWMGVATRLGDIVGAQTSQAIEKASEQAETSGYGGMLRVGEMVLVGIKKLSLDAAYFDLPEGAEIVDTETMSSRREKTDHAADDTDLAKTRGVDAQEAAQEDAEQTSMDEVRKGIDGLFKKRFK